ncbi:hypothetical protein KJ713_01155 [Patescibacteria group bacterium]|nr:hypothetical protein [Patescibacteria group bacterium]
MLSYRQVSTQKPRTLEDEEVSKPTVEGKTEVIVRSVLERALGIEQASRQMAIKSSRKLEGLNIILREQ